MRATRELPAFRADDPAEQAALDASRAVIALFLDAGTSDFPVRALAEHTGLSERTFYRVFPRKEDAVRPYLAAGLAAVVARVREAPSTLPLRAALVEAHAGLLDRASGEAGATLLATLEGSARLRALWLALLVDAERAFAEAVAARLGVSPESARARLLGALVVAAGRLALRPPPGDPRPRSVIFAEALDLLDGGLWAPPPVQDRPSQEP